MLSIIEKNKNLLSIALVTMLVFVALLFSGQASAAGTASFSLSPSNGTLKKNSTLSVTVNVSSTDEINAVQADVAYDSSKLDYVGHSFSGSAFDFSLGDPTDSSGVVSVVRGKNGVLTGTNKLVTLSFKVLGDNGTASLTFGSGSGISASGGNDVWNGSPTGGSYKLEPASGQTGGSSGNASNQGGPVDSPAESGAPSEDETRINSELDDDQPVTVANIQDKTEYLIAIKVLDKDGNAVVGTEVKLADTTATTDSEGIANFNGIVAGTYTVEALGTQQEIKVTTGDPAEVQNFVFSEKEDTNYLMYGTIAAGALVLILLVVFAVKKLGGRGKTGSKPSGYSPVVGGNNPTNPPATTNGSANETIIQPTAVAPEANINQAEGENQS